MWWNVVDLQAVLQIVSIAGLLLGWVGARATMQFLVSARRHEPMELEIKYPQTLHLKAIMRKSTAMIKNPLLEKIWTGFFCIVFASGVCAFVRSRYVRWREEKCRKEFWAMFDFRRMRREAVAVSVFGIFSGVTLVNLENIASAVRKSTFFANVARLATVPRMLLERSAPAHPPSYVSSYKSMVRNANSTFLTPDAVAPEDAAPEDAIQLQEREDNDNDLTSLDLSSIKESTGVVAVVLCGILLAVLARRLIAAYKRQRVYKMEFVADEVEAHRIGGAEDPPSTEQLLESH